MYYKYTTRVTADDKYYNMDGTAKMTPAIHRKYRDQFENRMAIEKHTTKMNQSNSIAVPKNKLSKKQLMAFIPPLINLIYIMISYTLIMKSF